MKLEYNISKQELEFVVNKYREDLTNFIFNLIIAKRNAVFLAYELPFTKVSGHIDSRKQSKIPMSKKFYFIVSEKSKDQLERIAKNAMTKYNPMKTDYEGLDFDPMQKKVFEEIVKVTSKLEEDIESLNTITDYKKEIKPSIIHKDDEHAEYQLFIDSTCKKTEGLEEEIHGFVKQTLKTHKELKKYVK